MHAMLLAYRAVDEHISKQEYRLPIPYGRDQYETWMEIEKSINVFDRQFNRIEKFDARKFNDPDQHDRRERRMIEAKN